MTRGTPAGRRARPEQAAVTARLPASGNPDADAPATTVEFVPERDGRAVTVHLDGHPASFVDLDDPRRVEFEYLDLMSVVLDALPAGRLTVTHIGGGGLTLARYVQASRPGSPQLVLEPNAALTELVRRRLPLPAGHRIRVRAVDGQTGVPQLAEASADVVVLDAYAGGRVPADLTTTEFLGQAARVLRPAGVALLNLADEPGLAYLTRVAAGLRCWLPQVAVVAAHDVLKGRRFGNAVLVGSAQPLPLPEVVRRLAGGSFRAGVARMRGPSDPRRDAGVRGDGVTELAGSGVPFTCADAHRSPSPPEPGRWRREVSRRRR